MNCTDFLLPQNNDYEDGELFVLGQKETLSYVDLRKQVVLLADCLNKKFGSGNNIVLLSPNSNFFIVSYLAVMKSGNVVVPLNPNTEAEQLEYIKKQSAAKLIFVPKLLKNRLKVKFEDIWCEEEIEQHTNEKESINHFGGTDTDSDSLAQIIYTSGSTAMPKGVMISHKNIIANTTSIIEYLGLSSSDIMEVVLPFFYCYGLSLLHTHLRVKGKIVLNNNFIFLGSVVKDLITYKCTGFAGVPSHFQILLRKSDSFTRTDFPHLRYVTQAGGKLHNIFIQEFKESHPLIKFIVMYGQTEATARLSFLPDEKLNDKLGSLGKGIPGVELSVVDLDGNPVKPGAIGEIVAMGDNVMMGYYKDEKSTNDVVKGEWLYTGDMATIDEDGYIYHTARKKEILKVGGRRVSPKEIEEVVVSIPGVVDCTVEAEADDVLGEAIKVTLVINDTNTELNEQFVKEFCSTKLASYKIPHIVKFTSRMEVNAAGKKVRK